MVRGFFVGDCISSLLRLTTYSFKQSGKISRTVQNPLYLNVSLHDRVKNQITSVSDHFQTLGAILSRNALIRLSDQVITPYASLANERTCTPGIITSDKAGNLLQILP